MAVELVELPAHEHTEDLTCSANSVASACYSRLRKPASGANVNPVTSVYYSRLNKPGGADVTTKNSSEIAPKDDFELYDYIPTNFEGDTDIYDYESPYWMPSHKKMELLTQFRKLRIQSVSQKDLE